MIDTCEWRPSASVRTARNRARLLREIRRFFEKRNVLEVDTPALSRAAVTDPHIDSIRACLDLCPGDTHYLRTSPEFAMKRLLCAGYPDVFEIARVFRDGECGLLHQPEFTLVEWYRRGFDLDAMIDDTVALLMLLIETARLPGVTRRLSYREAFLEFAGLDPFVADIGALCEASTADNDLAGALGDRRDAWLDLLLATRVAPAFASDALTVMYHYPASQAALARLSPDDPAVAERFEVFRGPLELANGFVELGDATEQAGRFASDLSIRRERGKAEPPLDRRFLAGLASGLPACAGVAVGFDRVLMINEATKDIRSVVSFAFDETS